MMDNIKALNRLETTKDYLKELYREQVENCPYPELKAIAKQTYEDNQMAFNIAIKAIKESNRQQSKIQALEMDNRQLQNDIINANCNGDYIALLFEEEKKECDKLRAEIEDLKKVVIDDYATEYDNKIKAEAVKEFAERLIRDITINNTNDGYLDYAVDYNCLIEDIQDLVKEMVGEVWDDMEVIK